MFSNLQAYLWNDREFWQHYPKVMEATVMTMQQFHFLLNFSRYSFVLSSKASVFSIIHLALEASSAQVIDIEIRNIPLYFKLHFPETICLL